ncbi:MAG TPA: glutamate racemase [archaeon]|nr:glutamate racemase [archaeon]
MIGIFDSGVGGLAVFQEIDKLLPGADILYLADNAAFPYGLRSPEFIKNRTSVITRTLLTRGAGLVVVACNTATVVAIQHLRENFNIPFVGVEPPVKVASQAAADNEPIYVLLTKNTATGRKYAELVKKFGDMKRVKAFSLPLLAQVVEDGTFSDPQVAGRVARLLARRIGKPPQGAKVVLGCTHYVFLKGLFRNSFGPDVEIFDPSRAVADQVVRILEAGGMEIKERGQRLFLCTGDAQIFARNAAKLLGLKIPEVELLEL